MNKHMVIIVAMLLFAGQVSAQEVQTSATSAASVAPAKESMIQDARGAYKTIREGDAARQAEQLRENMSGANETTRESIRTTREDVQEELQQKRAEVRGIATSSREELKKSIEEQREAVKQRMEQVKQNIEDRREEFKKTMEAKREEVKQMIETRREELKKKLETIRDGKKRTAVETIDKRLEEINANRVEHFSKAVDQLEKVLQNVESRAAKAEEAGRDIAGVKADITAAEMAIAAARAAIVAQSAKSYVLTINQEDALRVDVGKTRQALQNDLKVVFDAAKAVREAIRKAATDLAKIPGVNTVDVSAPAATSTGTSTNQ